MILLNGHGLTPVRGVPAEALSLQLKERDATASLTPLDMDGIGIGSWMLDDRDPGRGIVWRVKGIRQVFATRTPTVDLEHAINTLRDRILFGEIKAGTITGTGSSTCTARQAIQYILRQQSDWVLGQFDFNVSNPYKFDGDTLYDALETVSDSLDGAWWSYDFSSYPFKLNITRAPSGVACELRAGRNLNTLTKTVDKSSMYTRFYPIGADDLHISGGGYVEKNVNLYGVVSKVETDQTLTTEAELRAWANERLNKHAEPRVTITAEGVELADATGEPLDRLTLGRICRIPLPEFSTNIEERITEISYPDKVHQPENVKLTLANSQEDVTRIIAESMKRGGRGSRASTRQDKQDHAWFEDTNDHVAMCAEGIIGRDASGEPNWTRLSQIIVDGEGIHQRVQSIRNDVVIAEAGIEMHERSITQFVKAIGKDGKITAASIVLAINTAGESEARIDANKVYIGNQKSTTVINGKLNASDVTADYLKAKLANVSNLGVASLYAGQLYVKDVGSGNVNVAGGFHGAYISSSGNTYTLHLLKMDNSAYSPPSGYSLDFSRAVSNWNGSGWSNGRFTAKANPQNQTFWTEIVSGGATWDGLTATIPIQAIDQDQQSVQYNTGRNVYATFTPDWSYSSAITFSSSEPTGTFAKSYSVNKSYAWGYFTITMSGQQKRIKLHMI